MCDKVTHTTVRESEESLGDRMEPNGEDGVGSEEVEDEKEVTPKSLRPRDNLKPPKRFID